MTDAPTTRKSPAAWWFSVPLYQRILGALIVGFILPFDRVLDMIRTVPNVTADLAVATAVGRWEKEIDIEVYKGPDPS